MAEQTAQDVVTQAQSMSDPSLVDGSGSTQTPNPAPKSEDSPKTGASDSGVDTSSVEAREKASVDSVESGEPIGETRRDTQDEADPASADTEGQSAELAPAGRVAVADEAPSNSKDGVSSGEVNTVQTSDDAGEGGLAEVDGAGSAEADNNARKSEGAEQRFDRLSAIKKPAAFKAVSVTKTYLAKTGTSTVTATKGLGDKSASGGLASGAAAALRPRLVAKAGQGRQSALGTTGTGTAGPDASTVWNRNRPAPPPQPKHYTDEELKQQYGIQLASRLGPDVAGTTTSKWADEDEDDTSWLPEPVEYADTSVSAATSLEAQPSTTQEQATASTTHASTGREEPLKEPPTAEARLSSITTGKTILRPGARILAPTKPGLILKSLPDKPTQPEKPDSNSSVRSPWAKLPPVEKAPITFVAPTESRQSMPSHSRDTYQSDDARLAPLPAYEIGPNEFSRGWRDEERSASKELYNSQSGRYEPVKASRRLSRHEPDVRTPLLLQRASHQRGTHESSPISDLNRKDSIPEGRSRNRKSISSANVDESDLVSHSDVKRESDAPLPSTEPSTSEQGPSASDWQSNSAGVNPTSFGKQSNERGETASDPAAPPAEDPRVVQQRLMREKREAARKRKQEEEAKEEAAKRERIAAKLAALGPPPEQAQSKSDHPATSAPTSQPQTEAKANTSHKIKEQTRPPPFASSSTTVQPDSQTRQPLKLAEREKTTVVLPSPPISETKAAASPARIGHRLSESTAPLGLASPSRKRLGQPSLSKSLSDPAVRESGAEEEILDLPGLGQPPPSDRPTNTWQNVSLAHHQERPHGWPGSPRVSNVWGPPSEQRQPLTNSIFERGLPHINLPSQVNSSQAPHAETASSAPSLSPGLPFDGVSNNAISPQPIQPLAQRHIDNNQQSFRHHNNMSSAYAPQPYQQRGAFRSYGAPPPPAHLPQDMFEMQAKSAWSNFGKSAPLYDAELVEYQRREREALLRAEGKDPSAEFRPTYHETFKQTTSGEVLGQRHVISISKTVHGDMNAGMDMAGIEAPILPSMHTPVQSAVQAPIGTPFAQQHSEVPSVNLPVTNNTRGGASRFFGQVVGRPSAVHFSSPPPLEQQGGFNSPVSPPPPESSAHPVYAGSAQPVVQLPPPTPRVKLPTRQPAPLSASDTPVQMPQRPFRAGIQPIVNNADWQQRFNGLFARNDDTLTTSPPAELSPALNSATPAESVAAPKPATITPAPTTAPVLPAEAVSKIALNDAPSEDTNAITKVALPLSMRKTRKDANVSGSIQPAQVESKPMVDDALWDDRHFGSLPVVNMPEKSMWEAADASKPLPQRHPSHMGQKYQQLELSRDFAFTVGPPSPIDVNASETASEVTVRMPGKDGKTLPLVKHVQQQNIPREPRKQKFSRGGKKFNTGMSSDHDAPSGVENERRPARRNKRVTSDNVSGVEGEKVYSSTTDVDSRPPRVPRGGGRGRGGYKRGRGGMITSTT